MEKKHVNPLVVKKYLIYLKGKGVRINDVHLATKMSKNVLYNFMGERKTSTTIEEIKPILDTYEDAYNFIVLGKGQEVDEVTQYMKLYISISEENRKLRQEMLLLQSKLDKLNDKERTKNKHPEID